MTLLWIINSFFPKHHNFLERCWQISQKLWTTAMIHIWRRKITWLRCLIWTIVWMVRKSIESFVTSLLLWEWCSRFTSSYYVLLKCLCRKILWDGTELGSKWNALAQYLLYKAVQLPPYLPNDTDTYASEHETLCGIPYVQCVKNVLGNRQKLGRKEGFVGNVVSDL